MTWTPMLALRYIELQGLLDSVDGLTEAEQETHHDEIAALHAEMAAFQPRRQAYEQALAQWSDPNLEARLTELTEMSNQSRMGRHEWFEELRELQHAKKAHEQRAAKRHTEFNDRAEEDPTALSDAEWVEYEAMDAASTKAWRESAPSRARLFAMGEAAKLPAGASREDREARESEAYEQALRRLQIPAPKIRALSAAECSNRKRGRYILKNVIAGGDLVCVFGAPGAGKSVVMPHIAHCVARGVPAFGRRTRRGAVLYVAAEDMAGLCQRRAAAELSHGAAPLFRVVEGISDLREAAQLAALSELVAKWKPAMIVIDTIALAFPAIDENASADMGRVVAISRKLTDTGAAVVLIHHDTKAGTGTPRGHSILNGALDVAIHLTRDDATRIVSGRLTKNRNGTCDQSIAFRIQSQHIDIDEDGDVITAPIAVELTGEAALPAVKLPGAAKQALAILRELVADGARLPDGRHGVSEKAWREACDDRRISTSDDPKSRAKAFNRAFAELLKRELIVASDGRVSLPVAATQDFPALA